MAKTDTQARASKKSQGATRRVEGRQFRLRLPMMRLLQVTAVGLMVGFLVKGGIWLSDSVVEQPIEFVNIRGDLVYTDAGVIERQLRQHFEVIDGGPFNPDLETVQQQLLANQWIERAAVRRQWPGTLHIDITERRPVARWNNRQLMTAASVLFEPEVETVRQRLPVASMPLLSGPTGSEAEVWALYQQLSQQLAPDAVGLSQLEKQERGAWRMAIYPLTNDEVAAVQVHLGRGEITGKLDRLVKLLRRGLAEQIADVERIDLRYSNGAAVRWRV